MKRLIDRIPERDFSVDCFGYPDLYPHTDSEMKKLLLESSVGYNDLENGLKIMFETKEGEPFWFYVADSHLPKDGLSLI